MNIRRLPAEVGNGFGGNLPLMEPASLLSAIVDSCDDAIISKDLNGTIQSWNKGAERLFGYSAHEAIGQPITMLIPSDRLDEEPKILERLRHGERVDHFETKRKTKNGTVLSISLTISPIRNFQGVVVGASKVARDITERARHEEMMEEMNAALRRSNQDLQHFAYSASHDLQEPLRMIASFSELLQRKFAGQFGSVGDEYIRRIVEATIRMDTLLRDLRIFTQVSSHDREPAKDLEADKVLKIALANLGAAIEESGARIVSAKLPVVRMHEFELEQILQNLIGNAIRYRRAESPKIEIAAVRQGSHWLFSVKDNGIGIAAEFKEQIFGMFQRLHTTAQYPGTGMGLAICQRIIEGAGGHIWVESELGRGSTFFFTIPIERPKRNSIQEQTSGHSAI